MSAGGQTILFISLRTSSSLSGRLAILFCRVVRWGWRGAVDGGKSTAATVGAADSLDSDRTASVMHNVTESHGSHILLDARYGRLVVAASSLLPSCPHCSRYQAYSFNSSSLHLRGDGTRILRDVWRYRSTYFAVEPWHQCEQSARILRGELTYLGLNLMHTTHF